MIEEIAGELTRRPRTHLYVEVHGDDPAHTEYLADIVTHTIRGAGLALVSPRTACEDEPRWAGSCDRFGMAEDGCTIRLVSTWDLNAQAAHVGHVLIEWLDANLWGHYRTLGDVWLARPMTGDEAEFLHRRRPADATTT